MNISLSGKGASQRRGRHICDKRSEPPRDAWFGTGAHGLGRGGVFFVVGFLSLLTETKTTTCFFREWHCCLYSTMRVLVSSAVGAPQNAMATRTLRKAPAADQSNRTTTAVKRVVRVATGSSSRNNSIGEGTQPVTIAIPATTTPASVSAAKPTCFTGCTAKPMTLRASMT